MPPIFQFAWEELVSPLFRRPFHEQVAALCYRGKGAEKEVLLITSRGTGRWILPKGWPMDGKNSAEAAAQEAWEEAGVVNGKPKQDPIGAFTYDKELDNGAMARCSTKVFSLRVNEMADEFPEACERTRAWVAPDQAAKMVNEPGLKKLLRSF